MQIGDFYADFERLLTSYSGVAKLLRPLINCESIIELVHRRILCSTGGSCPTHWSLNRLASCAFVMFEHISRSNDTWSPPTNTPPGTSSEQMVSRVCCTTCSMSAGVVVLEANKLSISPSTREMTVWSLMTDEGRGRRKNSSSSVPRIDDSTHAAPLLKELRDWKSSTNLFTTKASTQRPITRAARSLWV